MWHKVYTAELEITFVLYKEQPRDYNLTEVVIVYLGRETQVEVICVTIPEGIVRSMLLHQTYIVLSAL